MFVEVGESFFMAEVLLLRFIVMNIYCCIPSGWRIFSIIQSDLKWSWLLVSFLLSETLWSLCWTFNEFLIRVHAIETWTFQHENNGRLNFKLCFELLAHCFSFPLRTTKSVLGKGKKSCDVNLVARYWFNKNVQRERVKCCSINHTRQLRELNIDKTKTTWLKNSSVGHNGSKNGSRHYAIEIKINQLVVSTGKKTLCGY